jgi:subtilisin family serine protease
MVCGCTWMLRSSILMKVCVRMALYFCVLWTPLLATADSGKIRRVSHKIPGEYIVVLRDTGKSEVAALADVLVREHGGRVQVLLKHGIKGFGAYLTEEQAESLARHHRVAYVEENGEVFLSQSYTVQEFGTAFHNFWHLDRVDNRGPLSDVRHAYGYVSRGTGVRAYVLDTGILAHHREFDLDGDPNTVGSRVELGANMMVAWNDYTNANDPCPAFRDNYYVSHGTSVASLLGGTFAGVAKNVTLVPVKVAYALSQARPTHSLLARQLPGAWIGCSVICRAVLGQEP